jgi:hypothetical protein
MALTVALCASACASSPPLSIEAVQPPLGARYAYAVYSSSSLLVQSPIETLRDSMARRSDECVEAAAARGTNPITDVFVLSHGWNFLLDESLSLYEGYRTGADFDLREVHAKDPCYEPFFIFVSWSSVTRPATEALKSVSPYALGPWITAPARVLDTVVFHLPSNWGETQNAFDIALGDRPREAPPAKRVEVFVGQPDEDAARTVDAMPDGVPADAPDVAQAPGPWAAPPPTLYRTVMERSSREALTSQFYGRDIPVSALVEELIRMKLGPRGFRLHTIGHSYGAKLISLATLDAVARSQIELSRGESYRYVDSMLLFNPAMKVGEMYRPFLYRDADGRAAYPELPEVAASIGRKGIVYTRNDSANGWVYAVSQFLVNNESLGNPRAVESPDWLMGVLDLPEKIVRTTAMTVYADVWSVAMAPLQMVREVARQQRTDVLGQLGAVLSLPLYAFEVHQAMGNRGLRRARDTSRYDPLAPAWLTPTALEMIEREHDYAPAFLLESSEDYADAALPLREPDANVFHTFDAADVYTGCFGMSLPAPARAACNMIPPGAHGDLRAYDRVGDRQKRQRTLRFIYNFTRR